LLAFFFLAGVFFLAFAFAARAFRLGSGRSRGCRRSRCRAGHVDLHVARALQNRRAATHRRRREALQSLPFVHDRVGDAQRIGVERRVLPLCRLLRIGDRRLEHLMDLARGPLLGEAQDRVGLRHRAAADQIDHEAHFPR